MQVRVWLTVVERHNFPVTWTVLVLRSHKSAFEPNNKICHNQINSVFGPLDKNKNVIWRSPLQTFATLFMVLVLCLHIETLLSFTILATTKTIYITIFKSSLHLCKDTYFSVTREEKRQRSIFRPVSADLAFCRVLCALVFTSFKRVKSPIVHTKFTGITSIWTIQVPNRFNKYNFMTTMGINWCHTT